MIATSDFRKGSTKLLWNNEPWLVIEFQHVKPGKGGAFVRTKLKNLITGRILDETFRSGVKFEHPDLLYKNMQYLYADEMYHFMDQESFEQEAFSQTQVESVKKYLKDEEVYRITLFNGKPISVNTPTFMELEVVETTAGVKGNTAQGGGSKSATMQTGVVIQVPLFIKEGDMVKVDTREDKYIERVKEA